MTVNHVVLLAGEERLEVCREYATKRAWGVRLADVAIKGIELTKKLGIPCIMEFRKADDQPIITMQYMVSTDKWYHTFHEGAK